MKLRIFQINAFATRAFFGNPAAVCPLSYWLDDDLMQRIAAESRVITAFFVGNAGHYAPGEGDVDFVSRWFGPKQGTGEDTGFTGSAHCSLVPFWAERLGKTSVRARQPSPRGATIDCELRGERVLLNCSAVKYLDGHIYV